MTLDRLEREIILSGGMDVKASTELQPETAMRAVTNLRWDAQGELRKRPTYASTVTPAAPDGADYDDATPEALFTRGSEVFALTADCGVAVVDGIDHTVANMPVSEMNVGDTIVPLKYCPRACRVSRKFVERSQFNSERTYIKQVVSAVYEDHLVIAWLDIHAAGGAYFRVKAVHVETGAILATARYEASYATASMAAIPYLASGSEGVLVTIATAAAAPFSIFPVLYSASARTFTLGTALTTNAKFVTHSLANVASGTTDYFYLAFCDNTSSFLKVQYRLIGSISVTHTGTAANPQFFSVVPHADAVIIFSATPATAVYAEMLGAPADRITVFTASGETFYAITASMEDTTVRSAVLYVNRASSATVPRELGVKTAMIDFTSATVPVTGNTDLSPNTWLANAAFSYESRSYVSLILNPLTTGAYGVGSSNTSVMLCRYYEIGDLGMFADAIARTEVIARIGHDRYFSLDSGISGGHQSTTVSGSKVHMVFSADASEDNAAFGFVGPQSIFHATVEFAGDALPLPSAERGNKTMIASGATIEWDGDLAYEAQPIDRPRVEVIVYTVYGTGDSFSRSGTTITFTDAAANFPADAVGRSIIITGSTTPGNDGTFVITARTSGTVLTYTNAGGATEAYAGDYSIDGNHGMVTAGTYSIKAIYRAVDAAGELHRSAPSDAVSAVATVLNSELVIYVTKPLHTAFDGETATAMEPEVYITAAGGTTYYLGASHAVALDAEPKAYASVDSTGYHWIFDTVTAGESSDAPLYADSGEILPDPPPAFASICSIGDRLWGIDAEDRSRVWYTKPFVAGIAPEWSTVNTLIVGDEGLAITDLSGTPTVLAKGGVWSIYGTGPDGNGDGQAFAPALRQPIEVSCIDPLVCKTSAGIVFRSRRGFSLLGSNGLTNLGLPIDPNTKAPSLADYTYARIVYDEVHNEVRIVDAYLGRQWVYNLLEQKWSEWTQSTSTQNAVDMVTCDGRVWYLHRGASSTAIRREYGADELDAVDPRSEGWGEQTPWIRAEGVAGFARLRRMHLQLKIRSVSTYNVADVNALTVTLETRGADPGTDTFTWTGAQLADINTTDGATIDLKMVVTHQRCSSFRVTITETETGSYHGSSPVALRLVLGVDGKAARHQRQSALKGAG